MRGRLLVGLLVVLDAAHAAGAPDAAPAWGGVTAAPALTELSLRTDGLPEGRLTVATVSGSPRVSVTVPADARKERVDLPVAIPDAGEVTLLATVEATPPVEIRAGVRPGAAPVIVVGDAASAGLAERPDALAIVPADLPTSAAAYAHVAAIAIGGRDLARLDAAQLGGLLRFVGNCGRTLLVEADPRVHGPLLAAAGCGGRFITAIDGAAAGQALDRLLARAPRALPDARTLAGLLPAAGSELRVMGSLLAGSVAIFLLLNLLPRARAAALAFCLLAAALPGLLWAGGSRQYFVAWAEAAAAWDRARYSSLDVAAAAGRGGETLRPAALALGPLAIVGSGLTLHWSSEPGARTLDWSTSLLQQARLFATGSFPLTEGLRADRGDDGITVCNHGRAGSGPAYLHWRGTTWALPALAPGDSWTAEPAATVAADHAALRLFERRAPPDVPSLLQRLTVPGDGPRQQAWLMRSESRDAEAHPCRG